MKLVPYFVMFIGLSFLDSAWAAKKPVTATPKEQKTRTIYPENQTLDFEGMSLEGELKAPGEFYFQNRNQERFDSLTKRRLNFKREMLRDSIQSQ